jgi:hypothetical protein
VYLKVHTVAKVQYLHKDYELYVTVAEEEEFLLATNEEEFDEQGGNDTEISDKR